MDTGQTRCYNNKEEISFPSPVDPFYGQDAQFQSNQPLYMDNGDDTVADKLSYKEAFARADTMTFAGYTDWRLPSIKELYSLIMFYGLDPSGYSGSTDSL